MRKDTIRAFQLAYPYALEDENPRRKNIDWLKSLRPQKQWKPSEEQMVSLERTFSGIVTIEDTEVLEMLWQQLKAL